VPFWRNGTSVIRASHRIIIGGCKWRKRTDFASAIVYERRIREFGFCDVPFGLSFVFAHRPSDNTARTKILDRTPHRNYQQLDRLRHWIANGTAWLYSSKPVLHLRVRVEHAVVAQETNTHQSKSGAARG
jgi:hypothetical protein